MGSTLFDILLVPGIIAGVFVFPFIWWHISYGRARRKILRLRSEGCTDPLAIYTFPFPHVVTYNPDEKMHVTHPHRTHGLSMWVDKDNKLNAIPVFGISDEAFR